MVYLCELNCKDKPITEIIILFTIQNTTIRIVKQIMY